MNYPIWQQSRPDPKGAVFYAHNDYHPPEVISDPAIRMIAYRPAIVKPEVSKINGHAILGNGIKRYYGPKTLMIKHGGFGGKTIFEEPEATSVIVRITG